MAESHQPIWIVVPAAGIGSRMGAGLPKQYLPLCGKTLLEITLDTLLQLNPIAGIVVALNDGDKVWPTLPPSRDARIRTVTGGERRCDSVLNAVNYIAGTGADTSAWVCVHDAARPCVSLEKINQLIAWCIGNNAGAILAAPVADTIKRITAGGIIEGTENRDRLWHAHTPQMFKLTELQNALMRCIDKNLPVTDEASAVEQCGGRVGIVVDRKDNIKVTVPEDLAWAEFILSNRLNR